MSLHAEALNLKLFAAALLKASLLTGFALGILVLACHHFYTRWCSRRPLRRVPVIDIASHRDYFGQVEIEEESKVVNL